MKLLSLEVHNFCQHRHEEVDFHGRLNVFLGNNGSGKSNLLVAALGALTGDFSRTNGKKADNICQFADDDEPSYVKLRFEHGGTTATVQRGLRGKQSYFQPEPFSDDKIRGDKAATAAVADLLGVSTQMLNEYVFVEQGEIFAPLAARPAERARSFQKLFGISRAEKCWEVLGEFLIRFRDRAHTSLPDLDSVRARVEETKDAAERLQHDVDSYDDVAQWLESDNADARKLRAHERGMEVRETLDAAEHLIDACLESERSSSNNVKTLRSQEARLMEAVLGGCDEHKRSKDLLATYQLRVANRDARLRLEVELKDKLHEEQSFTPPKKLENYIPREEREAVRSTIDELKIEQRKCDHLLAYFAEPDSKHHKSECPTCGTHVDDIDVDADALRSRLDEIAAELTKLATGIKSSDDVDIKLGTAARWLEQQENSIEYLRKAISELPPEEELPDNVEELRAFVDEYDSFNNAYHDTSREVIRAQTSLTGWIERRDSAESQRNGLKAKLLLPKYMTMDDEERAECFAAVDEKRARHAHRAEIFGAQLAAGQHHERAVRELERVEAQHSEAALNDDFYDHLENVRTLLHRDNLPRIVSQNYLELLETDTNELLTLFDTDFKIRAIEGMGFEALFEDGRVQPAARLSGGQKVVLSLAFRIAVNAMFANDLSLLCLDEPTAYLDDDNLGCLSIALDRLRDLSSSRGLQCVLITHERSLGPLFDNVVQL